MTSTPLRPPALNQPDPTVPLRPVMMTDVSNLHRTLWPHKTVTACYRMVQRAVMAAGQRRGGGLVALSPAGNLIGYGQVLRWVHCAEISDLYVDENQRSQGIGTAIIQGLIQIAGDVNIPCAEIGVARSNPRALALYRRLGFIDAYDVSLDLGNGLEPVLYLRLSL